MAQGGYRSRFLTPRRRFAVEGLLTAGISLALALISIKIWRGSLSIPFFYEGDALFSEFVVKSVIDFGNFYSNPGVGFPLGGQLLDYTQGDNANLLLLRLLAVFSNDPAVVMNSYWLLTFPLTAVSAWWAMRALGISNGPATVAGVLFSLLPYHYWRGVEHLVLSGYYAIPPAAYLTICVLGGRPLFEFRPGVRGRLRSLATRRSAATLALCLLIGVAGAYYAFYACTILAGAAILAFATPGRRGSGFAGLVVIAAIGAVVMVNFAPALAFRAEHGTNPVASERPPAESEQFALSLTQLLLPEPNHRFGPFSEARSNYQSSSFVPSEGSQALGLAGVVGLLWILVAVGAAALARATWSRALEREAGVAALITFLIGTVGGVSSLIAWGLTSQLRGWNRISIFIGFFALLGVAMLLERAVRRIGRPWLATAMLAGLVAFGLYDQTAAQRAGQFDFALNGPKYEADERFVERIEQELSPGSAVYQLPYLRFPEGAPFPGTTDYEPLRGYLHSEQLRWSYGSTKGRSADFASCLAETPPAALIPAVRAFGFRAIWIDRAAHAPVSLHRLVRVASRLSGDAPLVSEDGRFAVFDLRRIRIPPAKRARLRRALPASRDDLIDCAPLRRAVGDA